MLTNIKELLKKKSVRYCLAGGWNTVFGYLLGVGAYMLLSEHLHIALIAILCNILAITMSFITYKKFVFKTRGKWLLEYSKTYLVYAVMAALSAFALWVFVDLMSIKIWLAQAYVVLVTIVGSFLGHKFFTFRHS